jgi:hypothetical protein
VFVLAGLAVASGAAATIRWQTWTPTTACLLCDVKSSDAAPSTSPDVLQGTSGSAPSYSARSAASTFTPGPLAPASPAAAATNAESSGSRSASAPRGWQPWGTGSGSFRGSSGGGSGPSTALGGMWRLMNLARPRNAAGGSSAVIEKVPSAPRAPRAAKPAPAPTTHRPSPPSASPAPATSVAAPVAALDPLPAAGAVSGTSPSVSAPATDPFHEHQSPAPNPFGTGPSAPGAFDPGGAGGSRGTGGSGSVSATPEPASALLLGTGLLGILGVLRKRRAL